MSNKFVDLNTFVGETLNIKLLNGDEVKIKKPSQKMFMNFIAYQSISGETDTAEIIEAMDNIIIEILNNNTQLKVFTVEDIKDYDIEIKTVILNVYMDFIAGITANPNSNRPQSQAKKKKA